MSDALIALGAVLVLVAGLAVFLSRLEPPDRRKRRSRRGR
jgi:hypothetical protein